MTDSKELQKLLKEDFEIINKMNKFSSVDFNVLTEIEAKNYLIDSYNMYSKLDNKNKSVKLGDSVF